TGPHDLGLSRGAGVRPLGRQMRDRPHKGTMRPDLDLRQPPSPCGRPEFEPESTCDRGRLDRAVHLKSRAPMAVHSAGTITYGPYLAIAAPKGRAEDGGAH